MLLLVALAGCAEGTADDPDAAAAADDDLGVTDDLGPTDDLGLTDDLGETDAGARGDLGVTDLPSAHDVPTAADLSSMPADTGAVAPADVSAARDAGRPAAVCGDGVRDPAAGEACDDGNQLGGDACSPDCREVLCTDGSRRLLDAAGHCYWRDPTVSGRSTAVARCAAGGGYLAVFETQAELDAVYPAVGLGGSNRVWAALQRVGATWQWDNGAPLTFTVFRSGEPSGDGPCAEWGPSNNFNDLPCDVRRDAVCERPPPGRAP